MSAPRRILAALTKYHADDSLCPPNHRHTVSSKPLHRDCPGRAYWVTACQAPGCSWAYRGTSKQHVNETRQRHVEGAAHNPAARYPGPAANTVAPRPPVDERPLPRTLQDLLALDY